MKDIGTKFYISVVIILINLSCNTNSKPSLVFSWEETKINYNRPTFEKMDLDTLSQVSFVYSVSVKNNGNEDVEIDAESFYSQIGSQYRQLKVQNIFNKDSSALTSIKIPAGVDRHLELLGSSNLTWYYHKEKIRSFLVPKSNQVIEKTKLFVRTKNDTTQIIGNKSDYLLPL